MGQGAVIGSAQDVAAPAQGAALDWRLRFEAALDAAGEVAFEWDLASGGITYRGLASGTVFGHPPEAVDELSKIVEFVHPDDRDRFLARLEESLVTLAPSTYIMEYRLRCADGRYTWVESRGRLIFQDGRPTGVGLGLLIDISARKQLESRLGLSALILQSVREAVAVLDAAGRISWANAAFDALVGRRAGGDVREWAEVCAAADAAGCLMQARLLERAALLGHDTAPLRMLSADGRCVDLELSVTCVVGERAPLWIVVHRDVTQRVVAENRILETSRDEQSRLGVALHEGLGQDLAGASFLLRAARADIAAGQDAGECLDSVEALLQSAVGRCADLAQRLSPFLLDRSGLGNALQDLSRRLAARSGRRIVTDVQVDADATIDGNCAYHVFRVAQSVLDLALQAQGGVEVHVVLRASARDGVSLTVAATGVAAMPLLAADWAGTLRHRASVLGGSMEWHFADPGEACWLLRAPLRAQLVARLAAAS